MRCIEGNLKPGDWVTDGRGSKTQVAADSVILESHGRGRCANDAYPGLVVCARCAAFYTDILPDGHPVLRTRDGAWISVAKVCFHCRELILDDNTVEVPQVNDYGPRAGLMVDYYWAHADCAHQAPNL